MKPRHFAAVGIAVAGALALPASASAASWDDVAECESSGDWSTDTGNGYSGGLQFDPTTWSAFGGDSYASDPGEASREQQIEVAERVLEEQGPSAWPNCFQGSSEPAPEPQPQQDAPTAHSGTQGPQRTYEVRPGDTLSLIAQHYGVSWQEVYENNTDVIDDPDTINEGQTLEI